MSAGRSASSMGVVATQIPSRLWLKTSDQDLTVEVARSRLEWPWSSAYTQTYQMVRELVREDCRDFLGQKTAGSIVRANDSRAAHPESSVGRQDDLRTRSSSLTGSE